MVGLFACGGVAQVGGLFSCGVVTGGAGPGGCGGALGVGVAVGVAVADSTSDASRVPQLRQKRPPPASALHLGQAADRVGCTRSLVFRTLLLASVSACIEDPPQKQSVLGRISGPSRWVHGNQHLGSALAAIACREACSCSSKLVVAATSTTIASLLLHAEKK